MFNKYYILFIIIILISIILQSFYKIEKFISEYDNEYITISDNYINFKSIIYDKDIPDNDKQQYTYEYNVYNLNPVNEESISIDENDINPLNISYIEGFANNNINNLIQVSDLIFDVILQQINENNSVPNKLLNGTNKTKLKIFIDPYVNYYLLNNKNREDYKYHNKNGYFIRITPFKLGHNDCSWDLENKTIAYTCMTDYYFIMAMIKGYRMDKESIKLVKINSLQLSDYNQIFHRKKLDMLITYVVEDSVYSSILQNINYNATGFKDMDLNRIKAFYPFPNENYMKLTSLFKKEISPLTINNDNDMLVPSMYTTYLDDIDINNTDTNVYENFITRLEMSKDAFDPTYLCFGNISIENKAFCNSPFDVDGNIKRNYTVWDKICLKNEDCPFYRKNYLYDNDYGKCNNGTCEMPVGIKKLGFTKYTDEGKLKPFCYGCHEDDLNCCSYSIYPDYVFPNDFEDREKLGKQTIISKIDYVY